MDSKILSCRACMELTETMYPIFDMYESDISMASIIRSYIPLTSNKLIDDDGLPNHLCEECAVILIKFHNFVVVYEATQQKLLEIHQSDKETTLDPISGNITTQTFENHENMIVTYQDETPTFEYNSDLENTETIQIQQDNDEEEITNNEESQNGTNEDTNDNHSEIEYETVDDISEVANHIENVPNSNEHNNQIDDVDLDGIKVETVTKFSCPHCSDIFLYPDLLQIHVSKSHHVDKVKNENDYASPTNRRIFVDEGFNEYVTKERFLKGPRTKCHICKTCGKRYNNPRSLQLHTAMYRKTGGCGKTDTEKKFVCDVCGRAFRKKAYLNDHVEIHGSRKLYKCPICFKDFKGRSNFARHKRYHFANKKQFICEMCGAGFALVSTLKTHHYLKHVRERLYKCLICAQAFALKSTLEKHVKRHQQREGQLHVIKYDCPDCDQKYLDKSSLKRHTELKHSEEQQKYKCTECPKEYTTYTNLAKHRRKKHPELPAPMGRRGDEYGGVKDEVEEDGDLEQVEVDELVMMEVKC